MEGTMFWMSRRLIKALRKRRVGGMAAIVTADTPVAVTTKDANSHFK